MAYQLSDLVTKVQQRVRDTGYSSTEIKNYINDTQNDVFNEYVLPLMRTSQNYTVTAGVADITDGDGRPTNFSVAIDLINTTSGYEQTIPFMALEDLERQYPDLWDTTRNPANSPLYWTWDGVIPKLFPAPAAAYTLTLRYYKNPTELTEDADVPDVPAAFGELLVRGAAYRVLEVKDNYDQAAVHKNKYDEILQKFVVRYSTPQLGTPVIMPVNKTATIGNF